MTAEASFLHNREGSGLHARDIDVRKRLSYIRIEIGEVAGGDSASELAVTKEPRDRVFEAHALNLSLWTAVEADTRAICGICAAEASAENSCATISFSFSKPARAL